MHCTNISVLLCPVLASLHNLDNPEFRKQFPTSSVKWKQEINYQNGFVGKIVLKFRKSELCFKTDRLCKLMGQNLSKY